MSGNEDAAMCVEEEEYDLDYSDANSEPDVELENLYFNSKVLKEDDPVKALSSFQKILDLEGEEKGEWGFRALNQIIKINIKLTNFDEMLLNYKQLLTYIKRVVTRNHSEKTINSILDYIYITEDTMKFQLRFYILTLNALKGTKQHRLWFKTKIQLGQLYIDQKQLTKINRVLKQLRRLYKCDHGEFEEEKNNQLLQIYGLEIQKYLAQENYEKVKDLYLKSLHIKPTIPNSIVIGILRECNGEVNKREGRLEESAEDFCQAMLIFKHWNCFHRGIRCLHSYFATEHLQQLRLERAQRRRNRARNT